MCSTSQRNFESNHIKSIFRLISHFKHPINKNLTSHNPAVVGGVVADTAGLWLIAPPLFGVKMKKSQTEEKLA